MSTSPITMVLSSTLTRPGGTTQYAQNEIVASSATAGSIVVPSILLPGGSFDTVKVLGGRLKTNGTTGFAAFVGEIDLWTTAPTFTNGDNAAYAVATGAAGWAGRMKTEVAVTGPADGSYASVSNGGTFAESAVKPTVINRRSGERIYWSLKETDATGHTPLAGQTYTLELDVELSRVGD